MQVLDKIAFIGGGNMATSMIHGLMAHQFDKKNIWVSDPNADIQEKFTSLGVHVAKDNIEAVQGADIIVLAVKPQILKQAIIPFQAFAKQKLWLSIAAGIDTRAIEKWLEDKSAIIRAMPNTPALIGAGVSGAFANINVNSVQKQAAEQILQAIGKCYWFDKEEELDVVTAISGSGPAYFFLFMENLQQAAEKLGLSSSVAKDLVLATALGSAQLAQDRQLDFALLRQQVTSKGGTTEQALNTFIAGELSQLVEKASYNAYQRAQELKSMFGE